MEKELTNNILNFILAGKAYFTIVSVETQVRFTYRVVARKDPKDGITIHFVSLLRGADNSKDYVYIGCILDRKRFVHTEKSRVSKMSKSYIAFAWLFSRLVSGKTTMPKGAKFYHAGRCGRCGRRLTVPESIETGFGPECASKI